MKKLIVSFILFLSLFSCHKHEEESTAYIVEIQIIRPTQGQTSPKNTALPIAVILTREHDQIIHNLKVEVINTTTNKTEIVEEKHFHVNGTLNYSTNNYIPKSSGSYTLRITSTNDDKLEPNTKEVNFTIN